MQKLDKMGKKNFLILGRAGIDIFPDPPGTKTENAENFFPCLGGSAANIAVALVNLGNKASLLTTISDDALGSFAINQLNKFKVDTSHVYKIAGEYRLSFAVIESRVEDHQSIIYRNGAADLKLDSKNIELINFSNYGCLIVTGTSLAIEPSRTATINAINFAKIEKIPIVFDIDYRPYTWLSKEEAAKIYCEVANSCDIVVGNDVEFDIMSGNKKNGLIFAKNLIKNNCLIVVYKMGEHGSITFTKNNSFKTGIFPVNALKPTGAGDAFMGAFINGIKLGKSVEESVMKGTASAAIVVTRVGCSVAMPNLEELEEFIESNSIINANKVLDNAYSSI